MKREDFKEIREKHFEVCKKLLEKRGLCTDISCDDCPFDSSNAVNGSGCLSNDYCAITEEQAQADELCIKSAKEFLKFSVVGATKAALKDFSTKELTEELVKRGGVEVFYVDPYEPYAISVSGTEKVKGVGPAILIENID